MFYICTKLQAKILEGTKAREQTWEQCKSYMKENNTIKAVSKGSFNICYLQTRNVTVCNKCPRKVPYADLGPWLWPWTQPRNQSLAQDISCHFVLLFCVTLTLGEEP